MGKRVSRKRLRMAAPEWVFRWRRSKESSWHHIIAIGIVASGFTLGFSSIHIQVLPATLRATQKASLIHVNEDAVGRALTLRAREGGPFPSRFDPAEWEGAAAIEQAALATTRWSSPPYVPTLKDLPDDLTPTPLRMAARGVATLPTPEPAQLRAPTSVTLRLSPVLHPLSELSASALPRELPPFVGVVDASIAAAPWRFVIRLDAAGNVLECVSLAGGDEHGRSSLVDWLRHISFAAAPAEASRWLAVGVGFTNQLTDGPDSH